jgi:hypothetical protein
VIGVTYTRPELLDTKDTTVTSVLFVSLQYSYENQQMTVQHNRPTSDSVKFYV